MSSSRAAQLAPVPGSCNPRTLRCQDARNYAVELRECCRSHVVTIMGVLAPAMTAAGVRWWADYGTLLGAVRNEQTKWADYPWLAQEGRETEGPRAGIVPHDKDADLGALYDDWVTFRGLRNTLERAGFNVRLNWARGSAKIYLSRTNHTNVDVFFWKRRRHSDVLYRQGYAQVDRYKGREFRERDLLPFSEVTWEGVRVPAPRDPEAFLAMRYGPGWKTPIMANNDGVVR